MPEEHLRHPEIDNLDDLSIIVEENVVGFDVTMSNVVVVEILDS
jgi:hypothetical protein